MPASRGKIFNASLLTQASHLRWPVSPSARPVPLRGQTRTIEKEHRGEVRCAHERKEREKKPVRLAMKFARHTHLFHLTLTNLEQILPLEERASFSSLTSALFGERWTADGQRCLHSDQRVFSRVGIDGDRRQERVSPLFEMLRDDNFR